MKTCERTVQCHRIFSLGTVPPLPQLYGQARVPPAASPFSVGDAQAPRAQGGTAGAVGLAA